VYYILVWNIVVRRYESEDKSTETSKWNGITEEKITEDIWNLECIAEEDKGKRCATDKRSKSDKTV